MIKVYPKMLAALLVFCILLASTCKKADLDGSIKSELNKPFSLAVGEKALFGTNNLLLELSGINDSRCPADGQCIWAGYVKVELNVTGSGMKKTALNLCLGQCDNRFKETDTVSFNVDNASYSVILTKVSPYPGTDQGKQTAVLLLKKN
jgi:hypothetical protein